MTHRAIRELFNLVFFDQRRAQSGLILRRLPSRAENFFARTHETLRRAMASEAPFHVQRVLAPRQSHLADRAVTGHTADTFFNVNAVIEINEVGEIIDANPLNRFVVPKTLAYRLQHYSGGMDLRVAGHASVRRRNTGEIALFDRGVAIAAIDAELADVMAMAEGNRLLANDAGLRDIRGALDQTQYPKQPADKKHRAEDADFGKRVGARMKNLRH